MGLPLRTRVPGKAWSDYPRRRPVQPLLMRNKLAESLRKHRRAQYNVTRGARLYFKELGIDRDAFRQQLGDIISRRGVARVLDVGCGEGKFLAQLKKLYKEKIFTAGISLSLPRYRALMDESLIGMIEKKHFSGKFDLAVGVYSMEYADNPALFFERIYNSVRKGGSIFLTTNANIFLHLPTIEDALEKEGASFKKIRNKQGRVIALHIRRRSKRPISLRAGAQNYFIKK